MFFAAVHHSLQFHTLLSLLEFLACFNYRVVQGKVYFLELFRNPSAFKSVSRHILFAVSVSLAIVYTRLPLLWILADRGN